MQAKGNQREKKNTQVGLERSNNRQVKRRKMNKQNKKNNKNVPLEIHSKTPESNKNRELVALI